MAGRRDSASAVGERRDRVVLSGAELDTATWGPGPPTVVMLHDGLGSIESWRDIPARVAGQIRATVMAYNRPGHGSSAPSPPAQWPPDWMNQQAGLLGDLLDHVDAADAALVGHSDGASIALLHASTARSGVTGVLALCPHSYVEQRCVDAIAAIRREPDMIVAALGRHHKDSAPIFHAWSRGWTNPEFQSWDIRSQLRAITVPTSVVQGTKDRYATDAMASDTAESIGKNAQWELLSGLGHLLPREAPNEVVELITDFVSTRKETFGV